MPQNQFRKNVLRLALPVTLQSVLQSSFSLVDQVMVGQLGSVEIAAIGLAGKFFSIYTVMVAAVSTVAGILMAQAVGAEDAGSRDRSFRNNLLLALVLGLGFMTPCVLFPRKIMVLYAADRRTVAAAAAYLRILSLSCLPLAASSLLATLLRCLEKASLPLYAGIASVAVNTGFNYVLIFGKLGLPALGVEGAALASALSQFANLAVMLVLFRRCTGGLRLRWNVPGCQDWGAYESVLLPLLATELLWSLGENVYGIIYGHLGTEPCAAMTLLNPIQSLVIGALSGLSQAAGILVGKELGAGKPEAASAGASRILRYGLAGSAALSCLLLVLGRFYLELFRVEAAVQIVAWQIMLVYAAISPVKVQNMILGGVLRSGGKTRLVLWIDLCGTWVFGVPLGLLAAFVLGWSIPWVYLLLSLEECVRLTLGLTVFHRKTWIQKL